MQLIKVGLSLRDFFTAHNGKEIIAALNNIATYGLKEWETSNNTTNILTIEYAYNRLFIGPMAVPAPLYASAWLEKEPQLMGASTLEVRQLYYSQGFSSPHENQIPDDHIAYEIDFCLALASSDNPAHQAALRRMTEEHMNRWLPKFIEAARSALENAPCLSLSLALDALEFWFEHLTPELPQHTCNGE